MKAFKRFILIFFLLLIITPIALGGIALIKADSMPEYLVNFDNTNYDSLNDLFSSMGNLAISTMAGERSIEINEERANKILNKELSSIINKKYEMLGDFLEIKGIWMHLKENEVAIIALLRYRGIETTLSLNLGFTDLQDCVKINIKGAKVGQLPIPNSLLSYILKELAKNSSDFDFRTSYTKGEVNYDDLFITINKTYFNELILESLGSDLVIFSNIKVSSALIALNFQFNPNNPQAIALENALNELNDIINDDTLINNMNNIPSSDSDMDEFKDDFEDVIDLMRGQLENPETAGELTEEELALFESLADNFQDIEDDNTRSEIINTIEDMIDEEIITDLNEALTNMDPETLEALNIEGVDDFGSFIEELLGLYE